jgi:hypothetical protein
VTDTIYVYLVPGLPVPELVAPCLDGWTVQIDAGLTHERQLDAYHHALSHINGRDWEREDVNEIETDRH